MERPIDNPATWQERAHNARLDEMQRSRAWFAAATELDSLARERKFADLSEADKQAVYRLRGLGFVLARENEDVSDLINEPHFVEWVRWAIKDGPLKGLEV